MSLKPRVLPLSTYAGSVSKSVRMVQCKQLRYFLATAPMIMVSNSIMCKTVRATAIFGDNAFNSTDLRPMISQARIWAHLRPLAEGQNLKQYDITTLKVDHRICTNWGGLIGPSKTTLCMWSEEGEETMQA
ncbi:uncharacterized protein VTP21DRAFT_11341 [Calcarisporiella thermophila]|uniref:uncharacterized protein n=1 Tax=Calcarisporiella thermophila TaxID=911321 RepID=UPI003743FCD2